METRADYFFKILSTYIVYSLSLLVAEILILTYLYKRKTFSSSFSLLIMNWESVTDSGYGYSCEYNSAQAWDSYQEKKTLERRTASTKIFEEGCWEVPGSQIQILDRGED